MHEHYVFGYRETRKRRYEIDFALRGYHYHYPRSLRVLYACQIALRIVNCKETNTRASRERFLKRGVRLSAALPLRDSLSSSSTSRTNSECLRWLSHWLSTWLIIDNAALRALAIAPSPFRNQARQTRKSPLVCPLPIKIDEKRCRFMRARARYVIVTTKMRD